MPQLLEKIRSIGPQIRPARTGADTFFLPDFCAGRAVFLLVLVTELFVIAISLAATGLHTFSWDHLALVSLFAQWVVLTSAALLCGLRASLARLALPLAISLIFVLVLSVTALVSIVANWIMAGASLHQTIDLNSDTIGRNLIISAIMTGMVLRYFYVSTQLRKQEQADLRSRIQALQSRIRPHFLFNSMNIIASLISSEPETAEKVVEDLSELFRASLKGADAPVRLTEEIELCRRYVGIEQLRLGERLNLMWQIDTFPTNATIPLLSLQPLLENAIYHGIQPLPEGGKITVLIQQQTGMMQVTVTNPFVAAPPSAKGKSNHIALDNIRSRFHALYGERASLTTRVSDQLFVTQLSWPLTTDSLR